MYVHPIPPEQANGEVKAHYDGAIAEDGYLQNQELLFGLNPAAKSAWRGMVQAITARTDRRRYELVTLAAANELRCRYCVSAHASVLLESDIFDRAQVEAITRDYRTADCLTPAEVAIMAFAQKLTVDANRITPDDVDGLRTHGLTDEEIFDVTWPRRRAISTARSSMPWAPSRTRPMPIPTTCSSWSSFAPRRARNRAGGRYRGY